MSSRNRPTWKRYLKSVNDPLVKNLDRQIEKSKANIAIENSTNTLGYTNKLPQVYTGPQGRLERYAQYEYMDLDLHINRSLNIIAEFCTQTDDETGLPFKLRYNERLSESQTELLEKYLKKWCYLNKFKNRLYDLVRNVCKFGDQIYIRDPETYELSLVYIPNVTGVVVDETKGKKPEYYNILNLDYNQQRLTMSFSPNNPAGLQLGINSDTYSKTFYNQTMSTSTSYTPNTSRFDTAPNSTPVEAQHIVHFTLNKGDDLNWPFGSSILEPVFKTYRQKEMVEDSILVYLTQRAPERLVFKVDVGDWSESKSAAYMARLRRELEQRRIPTRDSKNSNTPTATYSPMSILENYFFPQTADGRGSSVEQLPGGDSNWGLELLRFFDNRLARGMGVPSSYIPTGDDDNAPSWNDGRLGAVLIQEIGFAKSCERIQNKLIDIFDLEFKAYLKKSDITISAADFDLCFITPQNYATWREIDIESAKISNFNNISGNNNISVRLAMKKYLGWSEAEINENTVMFMEENPTDFEGSEAEKFLGQGASSNISGLEDMGITSSDFSTDVEEFDDIGGGDMDMDMTDLGTDFTDAGQEIPDISSDEI